MRAILADKLYIPIELWESFSSSDRAMIKAMFIKSIFNRHLCDTYSRGLPCSRVASFESEGKSESSACSSCARAYDSLVCMLKGREYVAFYRGNTISIKEVLKKSVSTCKKNNLVFKLVDRRSEIPISKELQYKLNTKNLEMGRAQQQIDLAENWCKNKIGIIVAPPRFGKTLLCAMLAIKLNQRTLVITHQIELLQQFEKDFRQYTTIENVEKKNKRKLIATNPKIKDMSSLNVSLCTYQRFLHFNEEDLRNVSSMFGTIIVDEVHKAGAVEYSKLLNKFRSKYRIGVTATPKRRDGRHFIIEHTFGPVSQEGGSEQLSCEYSIIKTGWVMPIYSKMRGREWNFLWDKMYKNENRNKFIAECILDDVSNGYKVLVPVKRKNHIGLLHEAISNLAKEQYTNIRIAEFHGSVPTNAREILVNDIRGGNTYDVVLAINSMISVGFNAPKYSCIYLNVGSYSFNEENSYQEYSRIRTKCEGKKTPVIRVLRDNGCITENSTSKLISWFKKYDFTPIDEITNKLEL